MAWDHLSINRPHLAYAIIGGFTSLFMLVSLFVKEKLYIGEATVATICGIIFGPYGFNLFDPNSWGNVDQITLECSRIVLVVQCFAVGVELPKQYMTRHWKSVFFLLVPVMTFGWLICSLFIWWMIPKLNWLESLTVAACVTATDPVLASSVVGKGKFAKRIPKHLRDLLSAESGCNDGMAFPFIYMSLYLLRYRPHADKVFKNWFVLTVLYECLFGAILGLTLGYAGRQAIKWAEKKRLIDRESFLAFYFVLALFCAGIGSMLGADDLLVGFCAGVAFSNDGWFSQKTEESHVSNVIDLLLNLTYFVYFGAIIPWSSYNNAAWQITPWRLIVIAIFVLLFRRIPIMLALKPVIPDIKTWREALFAGHFGPIGVGAIFVAILARAELETGETTPLAVLPPPEHVHYMIIELIWPITTFLVIASIIVHGSSIAVFTLGKHVNTMRLTMSYTTGNDDNTWLNRLPIIGSRTTSMSFRKAEPSDSSNEKVDTGGLVPPGTLPPVGGLPGGLLSRVSTKGRDDNTWSVSDTAIAPRRRRDGLGRPVGGGNRQVPPPRQGQNDIEPVEVFQEGRDIVIENEQGDVITQARTSPHHHEHSVGPLDTTALNKKLEDTKNDIHDRLSSDAGNRNKTSAAAASGTKSPDPSRHKPVMAYRFDDNIIVEDADGEVIKRYKIPKSRPALSGGRKSSNGSFIPAQQIQRLGSWFGGKGHDKSKKDRANDSGSEGMRTESDDDEEKGPKFRLRDQKGRKMSKQEFIKELQRMDPHARKAMASETSLAMEGSSQGETHGHGHPAKDMRRAFLDHFHREKHNLQVKGVTAPAEPGTGTAVITNVLSSSSDPASPSVGNTGFALVDSQEKVIPYHATSDTDLRALKTGRGEGIIAASSGDEETWAERKRREAALGLRSNDADSDSEDDDTPRVQGANPHQRKPTGTGTRTPGIRFANVERREGVEVEISRPGSSGAGAGRQTTPENGPEDKPTELDGSGGEAMGRSTGLQWGDVVWGDRDTAKGKQKEA